MKKGILSLLLFIVAQASWAQFSLQSGKPITVACDKQEGSVVQTALELLTRDCQAVFSAPMQLEDKKGDIIIGTPGKSSLIAETGADVSALKGKKQAFLLTVLPDKKEVFRLPTNYKTLQSPSVEYRGICSGREVAYLCIFRWNRECLVL